MRLFLIVALGIGSLSAHSVAQQPIIDMHMHARTLVVRTAEGTPAPIPCMPADCQSPATQVAVDDDLMQFALTAMDRNNIVLGVVTDSDLDSVYRWADSRPGRFLAGIGVFNPADANLDRIRSDLESGRLNIVGEIGTQYWGYAPDDPVNEPFFSLAEEFDVPLLIHTEGIAGGNPRFNIHDGHPDLLEDVLKAHPNLRIWLENAAYPFLDEVIALMYRYPQVYADISTITWIIPRKEFYRYLESLMNAGLGKRLMWGSDQMNWPETIDLGLDAIREAPFLSEEEKRDILYNNAVEFLRLE